MHQLFIINNIIKPLSYYLNLWMLFVLVYRLASFNTFFLCSKVVDFSECMFFVGGSIPNELGEMDGRNAAAAAVGLVNGQLVLYTLIAHWLLLTSKLTILATHCINLSEALKT